MCLLHDSAAEDQRSWRKRPKRNICSSEVNIECLSCSNPQPILHHLAILTMSDGKPHMRPHQAYETNAVLTADFESVRKAQESRNEKAGKKTGKGSSQRSNNTKASVSDNFDTELYGNGGGDKFAGYNTSIAVDEDGDHDMDDEEGGAGRWLDSTLPQLHRLASGLRAGPRRTISWTAGRSRRRSRIGRRIIRSSVLSGI